LQTSSRGRKRAALSQMCSAIREEKTIGCVRLIDKLKGGSHRAGSDKKIV